MPATQEEDMGIIVYAPALVGNDGRPVAMVHGMERAFPGLRLEWMISDTGQFIPVPDRDAKVAQERPDGGFPLLSNDDESNLVTVTAWEKPAAGSPRGQSLLEVHARLPWAPTAIKVAPAVLEAVAEAAHAFWGHATPSRAGLDIARQTKNWAANPQPPPRGLPALKRPWEIASPEIPQRLGWLNYWSAAAARAMGFPDPQRDEEWLSRSRPTASGGWIVRLTEAPLELDDPTHLKALMRAYERFSEIGGRVIQR